MDVRDTVRAYRAMMASAMPGVPYNVCSGTPVPIRDLVELMRSKARVPIAIEQDPSRFRPNDTPLVLGDHSRLTADTGWSPQIPLEQTVDDLLAIGAATLTSDAIQTVSASPVRLDWRIKSEIIAVMATVFRCSLISVARPPHAISRSS